MTVTVTASAAVAPVSTVGAHTGRTVLAQADAALRRTKQSGGSRVAVFAPPPTTSTDPDDVGR